MSSPAQVVLELVVVVTLLALAGSLAHVGWRSYREAGTLVTDSEPANCFAMAALLVFMLWIIEVKVSFAITGEPSQASGLVVAGVPASLWVALLATNVVQKARGTPKRRRFGDEVEGGAPPEVTRRLDARRKLLHVLVFATIFVVLAICDAALKAGLRSADTPQLRDYYQEKVDTFWGPQDGLDHARAAFQYVALPMSQAVVVLYFYALALVFLFVELTRVSERVHFPLHHAVQKSLREKELDSPASYTTFAVGFCVASLLLPASQFLAALALMCFADAAASTVGMRWGKCRYGWNKKSLEGTLAGCVVGFLAALPLVGLVHALVAAGVFFVVDLATPRPVPASDNLLLPLGTAVAFVALGALGVPSSAVLLG
ncbi:MAG: hypothetical protein Kow0069_36920 [Promethearchaeota archaeon]